MINYYTLNIWSLNYPNFILDIEDRKAINCVVVRSVKQIYFIRKLFETRN